MANMSRTRLTKWSKPAIWVALLTPCACAQQTPTAQTASQAPAVSPAPEGNSLTRIRPTYVLGVGDQITIRAFEVEEISDKPYRIESDGNINLPILGRLHAAGLTVEQLEAELTQRLKSLVKNPQVTINVVQFRSEPVFLVGAFKAPGIYPLDGGRTLVEMLTGIGGLQPNASRRIKVTRRIEFGMIPLPNATLDSDGKTSSVEISIGSLRDNVNPKEDIQLQPFDVISVPQAEMVYVNGDVGKVGGIELGERDSISVTQLITMAGGLGKDAAPEKTRVLRPILDSSRRAEIPINLKKILDGSASDFPLLPNDVLYVPSHSHRQFLTTAALIGVPLIPTIILLVLR